MTEIILAFYFLIISFYCITITLKLDAVKRKLDKMELRLKCNEENMITLAKHLAELQLLMTRY